MKHYQLYYSKYCYFCQRVLFELRGKKQGIELCDISDSTHHKALVSGGGKGQVPCLKIENAETEGSAVWMYESQDIVDYLKQQQII